MWDMIIDDQGKIKQSFKIIIGLLIVLIGVFLFNNREQKPSDEVLNAPYIKTNTGFINLKSSINIAASVVLKSSSGEPSFSWSKVSKSSLPNSLKDHLYGVFNEDKDTIYSVKIKGNLEDEVKSAEYFLIVRNEKVLTAAFMCVEDSIGKGHVTVISLREAVGLAQARSFR